MGKNASACLEQLESVQIIAHIRISAVKHLNFLRNFIFSFSFESPDGENECR